MKEITSTEFFERFLLLPQDKQCTPLDFGRHDLLTMAGIAQILLGLNNKITPLEEERKKWLAIAAEYLPSLESPHP